jgi:putative membrane protein insertion efficiency factor
MFKIFFLKIIKFYQKFISPILGKNCRFYPSCSEYSYQAIKKYGVPSGLTRGFWRVLRCNPWNKGGIDLP